MVCEKSGMVYELLVFLRVGGTVLVFLDAEFRKKVLKNKKCTFKLT